VGPPQPPARLAGDVFKYYTSGRKLSAYQGITSDIQELLLMEQMEGSRYSGLEDPFLDGAKLFAKVMREGPFEETSVGSGEWRERSDLEALEDYISEARQKPIRVSHKGCDIKLSALGATLYYSSMGILIDARNKFNTHLEDRVREAKQPDRVKGIERSQGAHHPLQRHQRS
jgi:hypothetical protein